MSVQMTNGAEAAASPRDHRIDQYAAGKTHHDSSPGAASSSSEDPVVVDLTAAIGQQNAASAATGVHDLAAAQKLVGQLVAQLADQPAGAGAAAGSPSPRAVLSLLG